MYEFVTYFNNGLYQIIKTIKKKLKNNQTKLHKRSTIEKFIKKPNSLLEALQFFKNNSGHIDVLINGSLE